METIKFFIAGNRLRDKYKIFLTSSNRKRYNHNNDFETIINLPKEFYQNNFKFERCTGIYRTNLYYKDISQYLDVYCVTQYHNKYKFMEEIKG